MAFLQSKQKNMGMPARPISSQSFDEILSDLGDDPAIPDPHGIRKPPPQQRPAPSSSNSVDSRSFAEPFSGFQISKSIQKLGGLLTLVGALFAVGITFFVAYQGLNSQSQSALEESQKLISELKKEMVLMRDEIHQEQDDLYTSIQEIEVSIHSLKDKKPEIRVFNKPQPPSHEQELRRWRYLGVAQMGSSQQAYLHTGKSLIPFEKGMQVLGDWRLSNIDKEAATFTHPLGKSLVLKASKSE